MNIIPDKNLFIVTSAIKSLNTRFFNHQQRFEQTITTLLSIREQVPDAIILLTECSVVQLTGREREILVNHCDMFLDLSEEPNCKHFSSNRLQNQAESALMFNTLMALNNLPILKSVKRIFKVSGRSILDVGFNLKDYDNMFGKNMFEDNMFGGTTNKTQDANLYDAPESDGEDDFIDDDLHSKLLDLVKEMKTKETNLKEENTKKKKNTKRNKDKKVSNKKSGTKKSNKMK